jgi:hypothetical protein
MSARSAVYCSCGRLLKITVRRDGAIFRCPEHGIVWRYKVKAEPDKAPRKGREDEKEQP